MLADARLESPVEVLARQHAVQVHGDLRDPNRVPQPCDARVEVREERRRVEPVEREPRRERVLHVGDRLAEDLEDMAPSPAHLAVALEEQGREAGLDVRGRAVRERETVAALVVRALGHVLASALLVDQARGRIGKRPDLGIPDARLPDGVHVEHPAVPEARERGVHLARQHRELLVAGRLHVGPRVRPGREERAVLQEADALVDQRRVVQEVRQALRVRAHEPEHQSATDGKIQAGGACTPARAG